MEARQVLDRLVSLSRGYGIKDMASGEWRLVDRAAWERAIEGGITGWVVLLWTTGYPSGGMSHDYAYWTGPYGEDGSEQKYYAAGSDNLFGRGRGGVVGGGAYTDVMSVYHVLDTHQHIDQYFIVDAE